MFLSYTVQKEFEYSQVKRLISTWNLNVGSCTLLQTFDENGIKLLNSQHISSEANIAINQNYPDNDQQQRDDLPPPWILTLEIFNRNMNTIFQLKRKQEIGFFVILKMEGKK